MFTRLCFKFLFDNENFTNYFHFIKLIRHFIDTFATLFFCPEPIKLGYKIMWFKISRISI